MKSDDTPLMSTVSATPLPPGAKFPLGRVIITPAAAACVPAEIIARA